MLRREFIALVGGAVASPIAAHAQPPAIPTVGFLAPQSPGPSASRVAGFLKGLSELNYVEGRNVKVEYRWAEGQYERLRMFAEDLVRRQVAVIAATTQDAALAAKAATGDIPIVFNVGGDPVKFGLVTSMNRPGGNATGVNMFTSDLQAKRLGLLHDMVPMATTIGLLINPSNATAADQLKEVQTSARSLGMTLLIHNASTESDIAAAIDSLAQAKAHALLVGADPFLSSRRDQLVALAAKHRLPAIWEWSDYVEVGGLMSYGTSIVDSYRQVGVYVARVLKGEHPRDLPVVRPVAFDLAINLKTAKALGIEVPATLLARADQVVE